ncbi:MAG: type II secretion system GspH family protein [Candidatus Doudnabacteria bacterium]|nr:type II secretion system GspH family protein [Candidatus Doudnabacteria bacterium]
MKQTESNQFGFTLMELIITMAIIMILAAIVLVNLNSSRKQSRDAKRVADIQQILTALHLYFNDNNSFPGPDTPTTTGPNSTEGDPPWGSYLTMWPQAPQPPDNPTGNSDCTQANNTYTYVRTEAGQNFNVVFCLGSVVGRFSAGVHTMSINGIQ